MYWLSDTASDLFQLGPEPGGSTNIGAVENVEDYFKEQGMSVEDKNKKDRIK